MTYFLLNDGDTKVFMKRDPRGESESYEPFSLVGMRSYKIVWTEGIRKDRTHMRPEYRTAIDAILCPPEESR